MYNNDQNLKAIIQFIMTDNTTDYGYYGNKTLFPKRWLWWERIKIGHSLLKKWNVSVEGMAIVDFGCQFAFLSALLSHIAKKVYLVDISEYFVNLGVYIHKHLGKGNFDTIINSVEKPAEFINELDDNTPISLFLFFDVLEHVKSLDPLLNKMKSVLHNETYFLISLPTENLFYRILTKFRKETDHVNRYFEVEKILKENDYVLLEKKNLCMLFNIYLYKFTGNT